MELREHHGLELFSASELEFCVSRADDWGVPAFGVGTEMFTTLQHAKVADFTYAVEAAMEAVGIDVRSINTEYGAGQLEITFAPKFGIDACDAASTFKTGVKEIAQRREMVASFQSKPYTMAGLSRNAEHFIVGVHAPALEAFCSCR